MGQNIVTPFNRQPVKVCTKCRNNMDTIVEELLWDRVRERQGKKQKEKKLKRYYRDL